MSDVLKVINILYNSKICEGNCDDSYLELPNIYDGKLKDISSKLNCEHIISSFYYIHLSFVGANTVAALDDMRTGSLSIFHVECDILIKVRKS